VLAYDIGTATLNSPVLAWLFSEYGCSFTLPHIQSGNRMASVSNATLSSAPLVNISYQLQPSSEQMSTIFRQKMLNLQVSILDEEPSTPHLAAVTGSAHIHK